MAITLSIIAQALGAAIGFEMTLFYIDKADQDNSALFKASMVRCLEGQAYMGAIILVLVIFLFREKPPTPPSASSDTGNDDGFFSSIKALFANKNMILLTLVLG